jgi:hypothetical protein
MNHPPGKRGAGGLDDEGLLALTRSVFEVVDPVPPGLTERVRFAVALAGLEGEVARLTNGAGTAGNLEVSLLYEHSDTVALARGAPEESRTITFDSSDLTIMIRIDANADGTARVDGWLAPPRRCKVEIALVGGALEEAADDDGRFAFPCVPRGTVRIVVRPPERGSVPDGGPAEAKAVITPALVL